MHPLFPPEFFLRRVFSLVIVHCETYSRNWILPELRGTYTRSVHCISSFRFFISLRKWGARTSNIHLSESWSAKDLARVSINAQEVINIITSRNRRRQAVSAVCLPWWWKLKVDSECEQNWMLEIDWPHWFDAPRQRPNFEGGPACRWRVMPSTTTTLCQAKASYKKTHGLLELNKTHLQWTAASKQNADLKIPVSQAACKHLFCRFYDSTCLKMCGKFQLYSVAKRVHPK